MSPSSPCPRRRLSGPCTADRRHGHKVPRTGLTVKRFSAESREDRGSNNSACRVTAHQQSFRPGFPPRWRQDPRKQKRQTHSPAKARSVSAATQRQMQVRVSLAFGPRRLHCSGHDGVCSLLMFHWAVGCQTPIRREGTPSPSRRRCRSGPVGDTSFGASWGLLLPRSPTAISVPPHSFCPTSHPVLGASADSMFLTPCRSRGEAPSLCAEDCPGVGLPLS